MELPPNTDLFALGGIIGGLVGFAVAKARHMGEGPPFTGEYPNLIPRTERFPFVAISAATGAFAFMLTRLLTEKTPEATQFIANLVQNHLP